MTACSRLGSEKTNILMRSDFAALLIASRIGLAVSSGKTIKDRDIRSPFHHDRRREQFSPLRQKSFTTETQRSQSLFSTRSEEHTSELQSLRHLVCRLLLE